MEADPRDGLARRSGAVSLQCIDPDPGSWPPSPRAERYELRAYDRCDGRGGLGFGAKSATRLKPRQQQVTMALIVSARVAFDESAAARLGKSAEAVLRDDLRRVEDSKYPSADCLTPDDLEGLIDHLQETDISLAEAIEPRKIASPKSINSPWANALSHLTSCDPCRTLLSACLPSETPKQEFDTFLEKTFRRAVAHS
jgi:hypothetical protein